MMYPPDVMNEIHELKGLDLNLLVAFDAVARTGNVTAAARVVGVTQSAMSHTLRRLRDLFDDPLFVRNPKGVSLTPRAEALVLPVRAGLEALARAVSEPSAFDLAASTREFSLATVPLFSWVAGPVIMGAFDQQAPQAGLNMRPLSGSLFAELETGEIDLGVVPILEDPEPFDRAFVIPGSVRRKVAFRDGYRCYVREGHPRLVGVKRMGRRLFAELDHVLVSFTGGGPGVVDRALETAGLQRRVRLRVPSFPTAMGAVADSDLVLTGPTALEGLVPGVRSLPSPVALPKHAITVLWNPRFDADPGHRWFRGIVGRSLRG